MTRKRIGFLSAVEAARAMGVSTEQIVIAMQAGTLGWKRIGMKKMTTKEWLKGWSRGR